MPFEVMLLALVGLISYAIVVAEDWRKGLLFVIPVGFFQDPIRKLLPGEPVYMVVLVVMLVAVVGVVVLFKTGPMRVNRIFPGAKRLQVVIRLFIVLVVVQSVMSFARFGSPVISGIGLFAYLGPVIALWLTSSYARTGRDITRFLWIYVAFSLLVGISILMQYSGMEGKIFEEIGAGVQIYERTQRAYIDSYNGIMRSGEIAAWHAGAGACLLMIVLIAKRDRKLMILGLLLVMLLLGGVLLTGRRKMLMTFVLFISSYSFLAIIFRSHSTKKKLLGMASMAGLLAIVTLMFAPGGDGDEKPQWEDRGGVRYSAAGVDAYIGRATTIFEDAGERFEKLGLGSIVWAVRRVGWLGLGAGTGSQGAQHFGGGSRLVGGAAEGGLGKIVVELGVPGLVFLALIGWFMGRHVLKIIRYLRRVDKEMFSLVLGILAFLLSNIPIFIGASQVYGDPFVLLIMGCCLGFVITSHHLAYLKFRQRYLQAWLKVSRPVPATLPGR